jgi:hypothetical protein
LTSVSAGQSQRWAWEDLNLRPHPYQLNAGNRCADRPFPRSAPTVGPKSMRSNGPLVCVHSSWPCQTLASGPHPRMVSLGGGCGAAFGWPICCPRPNGDSPTALSCPTALGSPAAKEAAGYGSIPTRASCWLATGPGRRAIVCGRLVRRAWTSYRWDDRPRPPTLSPTRTGPNVG